MTQPLQFTAAEAAKLAPLVHTTRGLIGLPATHVEDAKATIAKVLEDHAKLPVEDLPQYLTWCLGIDTVSDRLGELCVALGVERQQ